MSPGENWEGSVWEGSVAEKFEPIVAKGVDLCACNDEAQMNEENEG